MKKYLAIIISSLALVSCATPIPHYFNVDIRQKNENEIDLKDKEVAVFSIFDTESQDSVFLNDIALGAAEKIESDRALEKEAIPIYSVAENEVDLSYYPSIYNVSKESGAEVMIFISSLEFGDYAMENPSSGKQNIKLAYQVKYDIYDKYSVSPIYKGTVEDELVWTILASKQLSKAESLQLVKNNIDRALKNAGVEFASKLSTQWEPNERMLIYYDSPSWTKAKKLAMDYKWDDAMDIWMKEVESPDTRKASCAAYNLALACDMQGDFDLADKWLDFAEESSYFSEIAVLRNIIAQSRLRAQPKKSPIKY